MKRKNNPQSIIKKLASHTFINFRIELVSQSSFRVQLVDSLISFICSPPRQVIVALGYTGLLVTLKKLDSKLDELAPLPVSTQKFSDINLAPLNGGSTLVFKGGLLNDIPSFVQEHYNEMSGKVVKTSLGIRLECFDDGLCITIPKTSVSYGEGALLKTKLKMPMLAMGITPQDMLIIFEHSRLSLELLKKATELNLCLSFDDFDIRDPNELPEAIASLIETETAKANKMKFSEHVFKSMVSQEPFHKMYPRYDDRKITILCAPTNSGKTYQGTQIIKEALRNSDYGPCAMLFPLRVLALQIQQDIEQEGIPCSMITGEEQDMREGALVEAMTVEIFDTSKTYNTVFVDEGQLAFGEDRSSGYLRVLCGADCRHLVIACAPSSIKQMEWYITNVLGYSFEIRYLERLTPLYPLAKPVPFEDVREGDLIVAFSRRSIHQIAKNLSDAGFSVGALYGALSPSARKAMLNQYRSNGYQVIVATDAIGMGVSAPAKRVLFAETEKFDGKEVRELTDEEYRQVAGRAGRYGLAESGEAGVLQGNDPINLCRVLDSTPNLLEPPQTLYVMPDKQQLMAASELPLKRALEIWATSIKANPLYAVSERVLQEYILKAEWLDNLVQEKCISLSEAVRLLYVTFPMGGKACKFDLFKQAVMRGISGENVAPPLISGLSDLHCLEDQSVNLTLYIQLSRIFVKSFASAEMLNKLQNQLGQLIAERLEDQYG